MDNFFFTRTTVHVNVYVIIIIIIIIIINLTMARRPGLNRGTRGLHARMLILVA